MPYFHHIFHMVFTFFWGLTGALSTVSSCCTLFFCSGLMAPVWMDYCHQLLILMNSTRNIPVTVVDGSDFLEIQEFGLLHLDGNLTNISVKDTSSLLRLYLRGVNSHLYKVSWLSFICFTLYYVFLCLFLCICECMFSFSVLISSARYFLLRSKPRQHLDRVKWSHSGGRLSVDWQDGPGEETCCVCFVTQTLGCWSSRSLRPKRNCIHLEVLSITAGNINPWICFPSQHNISLLWGFHDLFLFCFVLFCFLLYSTHLEIQRLHFFLHS